MWLTTQPRWLYIQFSYKFLLYLWVFIGWSNSVSGNPSKAIVMKARCYANCLTKNSASNETETPCKTNDCKECLGPCGSSDSDEAACKQTCGASSSCLKSCEFLTKVKNFSSIINGDNSSTPNPGIPSVTNRSLNSISLKWEAVKNTTGSPVYMIEMAWSGSRRNSFWSIYLSEVFVVPEATISLPSLCRYIDTPPFRSDYSPILYKFRVAVLTENSSLSVGQQTVQTTLVKPAPVKNVTLDSLVYDPANKNVLDRIKLTVSWIPLSDYKHLITKYAVMWELDPRKCSGGSYFRSNWETTGPDNKLSKNVYSEAKRCNHHLVEVRSMIGCSASDKATLIYTYPGCQNITNFPKSVCYEFDPPEAPIEDRVVRNIRFSLTAQDDYRFQVNIAWDPPVYPYKNVELYNVWNWKGNKFVSFHRGADPSLLLADLLPGTTYKIEVKPRFLHRLPSSERRLSNFTTPVVPRNEVKVQSTACNLYPSPERGSFVANISWNKPTFNYSSLTAYQLYYQVGSQQRLGSITNQTYFLITGVMHGEQVVYWITPKYKHIKWITGTEALGKKKAPLPSNEEVKVRRLHFGTFLREEGKSTFSVNFTWTGPLFNFTLRAYEFTYELTGYSANETIFHGSVTKPEFGMIGVRPKEIVTLKVTPVFDNGNIQRIERPVMVTAPEPDPTTLKVRNLSETILTTSKPDRYNYLVSWEMPFFKESSVDIYDITCSLSGNPDRAERWQRETKDNNITISDLIPGDRVEVEVIPDFIASVITGKPEKIFIEPPKPSMEKLKVRKLGRGLFVEDKGTNTFNVTFTWEKPSFEHSNVHSYDVSYEFQGGFARDQLNCSPLVRTASGCSMTGMDQTTLKIIGVFPEEEITLKVKPLFDNDYIIGQENKIRATAPKPNEELVKVIGLKHGVQVAGPNNTFSTTVWWEKPLFTHSGVKHYIYKLLPISDQKRRKRDTNLYAGVPTSDTNASISGINKDIPVEFQVTPVFQVPVVNGINDQIDISWKDPDVRKGSFKFTPAQMGGLVVGVIIGALIAVCLMIWYIKQRRIRMEKRGLISGKNALIIDHWEVDSDLVSLEEELGEGAFGKVYKGTIKQATTISRRLSVMPPVSPLQKSAIKQAMPFTVAVKMLHGMADSDQRREFLEEIQLMKAVGSHKNIVNMVGCCTVEEPMFLLTEYVPYGDLLHYLRKRRGKVKEYLGDESIGPYRSTYCETYVLDAKRGVSIQATRSDRIYVNTPHAPKGDGGNVQILSFSQSSKTGEEFGAENKGMAKDEVHSDEDDDEEDGLTPGDLLAFAWQISEGMEYLARKGFVHRDLAARNVLVGENKVAKVADFGLTRHVYEEKVYHAKRSRKLPLKWMSIEAIFDQTFTSQSDVWAFGVLLWELVTLGGTPYPTINNRELLQLLKTGYRMEKPEICNDEIYEIMKHCWMESPDDRPNFTQIRERLEVMMQKDNPYLDFSLLDESREYYNVPSFNSLVDETTDDEFLDKEDGELLRETSDGFNEGESIDVGDAAKRNELATMAEAFKMLDKRSDNFDPGFGLNNNKKFERKEFRELKDIKVDFDAIEMSLFRPGNKEIAL